MDTLFDAQFNALRTAMPFEASGHVTAVNGLIVQAAGLAVPVGALCSVQIPGSAAVDAEVIGFRDDRTLLMPLGNSGGLSRGQRVKCIRTTQGVEVGQRLLGRVIDAMGHVIDDGPAFVSEEVYPLHVPPPPPMQRPRIEAPISVGIRSINAMLTPGLGQRLGLFAGTGVGKSVSLGMMARYTSADVTVVGLVGERGREVADFLERDLGPEGRKRSVVVVSTSDQSPVLRVRAGFVATAVAEFFCDQGANVLLLMDSITRVAMAQRQIGLAAGEPPATKGFTPSVFSLLPQMLERSGRRRQGSITGLYTVLVEGDDFNEPISDAVRGILDGHIALSRTLAMRGHYPAINVPESISRLMPDIVTPEHLEASRRVKRLLAVWEEIADLVHIGAYVSGTSLEYDLAVMARPWIEEFLQQGVEESSTFDQSRADLLALNERISEAESQWRARPQQQAAQQVTQQQQPQPQPQQRRPARPR